MSTRVRIRLIGCLAVALCPCLAEAAHRVTVSAGEVDRHAAVASVALPTDAGKGPWVLKPQAENGKDVTVSQQGPDGRLWFVVDELKAGQTRTYELVAGAPDAAAAPGVEVTAKDGGLNVAIGERQILRYQSEPGRLPAGYDAAFRRGGYIQSVFAPSGALVTDDYPPNHKHHHAIWSPWTKTVFEGRSPDFWNMGEKTGTVVPAAVGEAFSGSVAAGFRATHRMLDLTAPGGAKPAIDEQWDVTAYAASMGQAKSHVFDLVITQTCASESPLELPKYHYGGLGFRGSRQWDGKPNCRYLTSEGKTRADGNETRAKWCHVGGLVEGKPAGVAILCHPENFRFPQPVRLHPEEPFFCFAPSQLGDWKIEPGKPYVAKYRFVVSDGEPDAKEIERLWRDYAEPVKVTVE